MYIFKFKVFMLKIALCCIYYIFGTLIMTIAVYVEIEFCFPLQYPRLLVYYRTTVPSQSMLNIVIIIKT